MCRYSLYTESQGNHLELDLKWLGAKINVPSAPKFIIKGNPEAGLADATANMMHKLLFIHSLILTNLFGNLDIFVAFSEEVLGSIIEILFKDFVAFMAIIYQTLVTIGLSMSNTFLIKPILFSKLLMAPFSSSSSTLH